ncbi:hypothetical protein ACWX0K_15240 [Nitrobacteraceae bacterium UC4446_H13]
MTLSDQVEQLTGPDRALDEAIWTSVTPGASVKCWSYMHEATQRVCDVVEARIDGGKLQEIPHYTASLDAIRSLGGMCIFASDIGADGLAMVKLVADTSTTPIIEYTGIATRLEHAWLAAALRMKGL